MKRILSAAVCLIFPFIASSQSKTESSKVDTNRLEEVVVVSSRFKQRKKDIAQQVQIINADRLQQLNAPSTADALQQTAGIMVQKSQLGGGSPIIRGFEASRVLLVVDGIRLNNAIYRSGHLQNVITIDHNSLDRMEVGYGPSSVAYGSDALGGVVHFFTKQPLLNEISASAFTRYSSAANERTGGFSVNFGKQNWASFSSFNISDFGDLRQGGRNYQPGTESWKRSFYVVRNGDQDEIVNNGNFNLQKQSGYSQVDLLQKFLIKSSDKVIHTINLQYSGSSDIPRYDRLTQILKNTPTYAEWYYGPQNRLLAAYQLQLNNSSDYFDRSNITFAYQNVKESRHDRRLNNAGLNNRFEEVDIFSLNADFNKTWLKNELNYGLEFNQNRVNSTAYLLDTKTQIRTALDTRYPGGGSNVFSSAAFLSHRYQINSKFSVNEGIRLSHINLHSRFNDQSFYPFPFTSVKQNNTAISGNLNLVYHPDEDWKLSLSGSSGFRAPNVDDLAKIFESVPGKVIVPNFELKPEYTYNAEIGIARKKGNKTEFNVNGFYTLYRNAITTQPFLFNGQKQIIYDGQLSDVTANVNAGKAYLSGVSAGFSAALTSSFRFETNATYTYARITSEDPVQPLDHIPPLFAIGNLVYQHNKFNTEFFVQYHGAKRIEDYNINGEDNLARATLAGMPSWYTINLRSGVRLSKSVKVQVALENILDRNYRVFASGISAAGRNLIVSLRGNF